MDSKIINFLNPNYFLHQNHLNFQVSEFHLTFLYQQGVHYDFDVVDVLFELKTFRIVFEELKKYSILIIKNLECFVWFTIHEINMVWHNNRILNPRRSFGIHGMTWDPQRGLEAPTGISDFPQKLSEILSELPAIGKCQIF